MNNVNLLHYNSYENKREYYDAIATGDANAIVELSQSNYEYPSKLFEECANYTEAMEQMLYEALFAAAEMCLVAIQNGLPDRSAYEIRDNYIGEFEHATSLPDIYDLIHGMAYEYAARMKIVLQGGPVSPRLRRMMMYIEEHLSEQIRLQDVADAADVSRTYASAVFRREAGMTMNEFILRERIAEAERLLASGRYTVSEVAERLGFCSASYFTQCFKRVTGRTPSAN